MSFEQALAEFQAAVILVLQITLPVVVIAGIVWSVLSGFVFDLLERVSPSRRDDTEASDPQPSPLKTNHDRAARDGGGLKASHDRGQG